MNDNIFDTKKHVVDFSFDKKVVKVFDDMVRRSVPGYGNLIELIGVIVKTYGQDNTNYYDLGASTGAVSLALGINNPYKNNRIIAIDNSVEMVAKCKANLTGEVANLSVICADINNVSYVNPSIVVLNLSLQFIQPNLRQQLINNIYDSLVPGGVVIIAEKIHFDDEITQIQLNKLHINFKRANGYSELEIANKRQAIENVLITDSKKTHLQRLKLAGFTTSMCYFQCLNFAAFLAIK